MAEQRDGERGQAQLELIAGLPFLLLAMAIVIQLFAILYAQSAVDGAAEAGAIAAADGRDPRDAARDALPGWAKEGVDLEVEGGRVRVESPSPAIVPWLGERIVVAASAYARAAD